jgi:hypothetical protein
MPVPSSRLMDPAVTRRCWPSVTPATVPPAFSKAVGATDEFRKMEGLNIRIGAVPGEDFLYMSISETNETMTDEEEDVQLAGDKWGAVYRLPLEADYDVSRMEPAVVGEPNANICGGCPYDA